MQLIADIKCYQADFGKRIADVCPCQWLADDDPDNVFEGPDLALDPDRDEYY